MDLPWRSPVMQAPIGPASTPALVAAVSGSGALGTLAAAWTDPAVLREQVRWIRSAVDASFCVNLVLAFEQRERLRVCLDEGVRVISFSWGVDRELIRSTHDGAAIALVQVGDVAAAVEAVEAGADVVIAQGVEAGGHVQGVRPTVELVREIRTAVRVPIVAAGGIGDVGTAARVLAAGADGFACGTVFLAAEEADVHPRYLERLIASGADDTALTTAFDGGWPDAPHRVLRNETLAVWEAAGSPQHGRPGEGDVVAIRRGWSIHRYNDAQPTGDTTGDVESMAMYAGTSTEAISRHEPAAEIVKRLSRRT